MAPILDSSARIDKWTDYYARNRKDGGPIQALFNTNAKSLARKTQENLNNVSKLTDSITGSSFGNMILIPGKPGLMQLVHHGFACNTREGFSLAFAHGNLGDCTAFKTIPREEMVAPITGRDDLEEEGEERTRSAPALDSMLVAESANEFAGLEAEGNDVLDRLPNHYFITPDTFLKVKGSKRLSAKDLAFYIIEHFQESVEDDDVLSAAKEEEASGLEGILAMLWASENGMLKEIRMDDVPEDPMMSHIIKDVRRKVGGDATTSTETTTEPVSTGVGGASMEMMARSSQSMVALLNKFQEGNDADRQKKESEKSILKTIGPTKTCCCRRLGIGREPSPKAPSTGCCPTASYHRMLTEQTPAGSPFSCFTQRRPTRGGRRSVALEESTLEYYMKQGYYTPSTPNDLRIQLQTALDMLQLLTCDGTIAGRGLAHILDPRRWGRMTTMLNDRFNSETEFGAKFCYSLDRHLQTFFDKVTRWGDDIAEEGQPRYLGSKADDLLERL